MKKILLFLTLSFIYLLGTIPVNASTDSFYEAEYIDNIYMVRFDKTTNTKYYQKARVYRRASDGRLAYCLQPFAKFNPSNNTYETVSALPDINSETLTRINDLIGFGYGYAGHKNDLKWYAITQLMIWQTVEPNSEFYFTDTLNGNKIDIYNSEIQTINNLINNSYIMPSFNNKTYYGIKGKPLTIIDTNNVFGFYSKDTIPGSIKNDNTLTITKDEPGCYEETFERMYNPDADPILFYYNPNSQHLATVGKTNNRVAKVRYCINELKLKIKKIDKDTGTNISSGEAKLEDSVFTLYNDKMEKIKELTLDDNLEINLSSSTDNLDYGTYYLKETTIGVGYLPNNETYKIEFTPNNTKINLVIENEVLKKEVTIKKYFGDGKLMESESNISFEIYDIDNKLVNTITTDQNGTAKITLPYGHYKVVQVNTTEGYTKIEPFEIFINDLDKEYSYTVNDYKEKKEEKPKETISIEVPNTSTEKDNYPIISITLLPLYFLAKKKFN